MYLELECGDCVDERVTKKFVDRMNNVVLKKEQLVNLHGRFEVDVTEFVSSVLQFIIVACEFRVVSTM